MQTIKNFISGSNEAQSGQEPVSGETGSGTATEPYDAGNTTAGATGVEGSENTFGRDRGGPDPNNLGPHQTSIANKLDPRVDSDGDGKPASGPNDFETTTGEEKSSFQPGANTSSTLGQSGTTGEYSSISNNPASTNEGPHSSELANKADPRVDSDAADSTNIANTTGMSGGPTEIARDTTDVTGSNNGISGESNDPSSGTGGIGIGNDRTSGNAPSMSTAGDSASRLAGQTDTSSGPGVAQGVNVTGGAPRPEHDTDKTGVTGIHSNDPKFQDLPQSSANESSVESRGQTTHGPVGGMGAVEPSVGADPASGQAPIQEQQGADRPTDEPSAEQADAVGSKTAAAEESQSAPPTDTSHTAAPTAGEEEKTGPKAPSKGEGTGEQWVKTSGMAADGGDFDAQKPGAGREAERLLEEKGIHHEVGAVGGGASKDPNATDPMDPASKPSMGQKIKEKLHIGKKS